MATHFDPPTARTSAAERRRLTAHPVVRLLSEHGTIRRVLDRVVAEVARMQCCFEVRLDFWMRVLEWLELAADRDHHEREEQVLFPLLARAGLSQQHGLLAGIEREHEAARAIRGRMVQAVAGNDVRELADSARAYVDALVRHVDLEERVLFPLAMELLDEDAVVRLEGEFDRHRSGIDAAVRERALALQHALLADGDGGQSH